MDRNAGQLQQNCLLRVSNAVISPEVWMLSLRDNWEIGKPCCRYSTDVEI